MIKVHRLVIDGDKSYDNVRIVPSAELGDTGVEPVLGEKSVLFLTTGSDNRNSRWLMTHADNISVIIVSKTRIGLAGFTFERIVVGGATYGPGAIILPGDISEHEELQALLNADLFEEPLVLSVSEGTILTGANQLSSLQSANCVPRIEGKSVPATSELLASQFLPGQEPVKPVEVAAEVAPVDEEMETEVEGSRPARRRKTEPDTKSKPK